MTRFAFRTAIAAAAMLSATLPQAASAQAQWPVGKVAPGAKWTVSRVQEGCYLIPNGSDFNNMIALAAGASNGWDSVLFTDPRLAAVKSSEPVEATLTFNGKPVTLVAAFIDDFGDTSMPPMSVNMFEAPVSQAFKGKPVAVTLKARGLTLTGTIDPNATDLENWRACAKEMRNP